MTDTPDLQGESTSDTPSQSTSPDLNAVADRLSRDRLSKYLIRTDNNVTKALELYSWNNEIGAAINATLQQFEICLRNAVSLSLVSEFGNEWSKVYKLTHNNKDITDEIYKTQSKAEKNRNGNEIRTPDFIAASNMNLWRELCKPLYAGLFWGKRVHLSFPNYPCVMAKGKERAILQEIHCRVDLLLKLRNRIAHHEPVIGSNREPIGSKLLRRHQEMFELLEWMDSNFAQWVRGQDRFHEVMNACPMTVSP
jgi:hypothetical protein